nr:2-amino-4-hydroxy-6-hydroxymethyldihydropteridine diphosphokinase [Alteromonas sp. 5E99-2]
MIEPVYIGLGSNLGDSENTISDAVNALSESADITINAVSSLYKSAPMGPKNQPDYFNAVCEISTSLDPIELLDLCQNIESTHGRERKGERWGPRTLDLDILLYSTNTINEERLTIPHAGIAQREFVLVPLFELAPTLIMPDGRPIAKWVADCSLDGLSRLR